MTVETSSVSGWKRSGERKDVSVGGGGTLDYAKVRNAVEIASVATGWKFQLEGGPHPLAATAIVRFVCGQDGAPRKKPASRRGLSF